MSATAPMAVHPPPPRPDNGRVSSLSPPHFANVNGNEASTSIAGPSRSPHGGSAVLINPPPRSSSIAPPSRPPPPPQLQPACASQPQNLRSQPTSQAQAQVPTPSLSTSGPGQPPAPSPHALPIPPHLSGPTLPNGHGASPNASASTDHTAAQARLALAQQLVQQRMSEQAANGPNPAQDGNGNGERRTSGHQTDLAAMANAMGMLNNMPVGAVGNKEAMMKQASARSTLYDAASSMSWLSLAKLIVQLQVLTNAHAQRARQAMPPVGQASAPSSGAPAQSTEMNGDRLGSGTPSRRVMPLPQGDNFDSSTSAGPSQPRPPPFPAPVTANGMQLPQGTTLEAFSTMPPQQREFIVNQQRIRAIQLQQQAALAARPPPDMSQQPVTAPSPAAATTAVATPSPHSDAQPPTPILQGTLNGPRLPPPRAAQVDQRKQFIQSLSMFYKAKNLPPPPEIFTAERPGAIRMGETWLELFDLFMLVMRSGGVNSLVKQGVDSPVWQQILSAKNIPNPLPTPLALPRPPSTDPNAAPTTTTNAVTFLMAVFFVYLQGFEQHMSRHRQQAIMLRHQQQAAAASAAAVRPAQAMSPAAIGGPPASASTPGPTASLALGASPAAGPSVGAPSPAPSQIGPETPVSTMFEPRMGAGSRPSPIRTDGALTHVPAGVMETPVSASGKKRKRKKDALSAADHSTPTTPAVPDLPPLPPPSAVPVTAPVTHPERPPTPKRARYRVEYRPLHHPLPLLAGWDERAVASTFPMNMLGHPSRSVHELGVVDMEAVLMSLRSRLPGELGYALTVLSMLSMPHPEENIGGLPLQMLGDIYFELLELIDEAVFGEGGRPAWTKRVEGSSSEACRPSDLNRMPFVELEQLGTDFDFGVDIGDEANDGKSLRTRDSTGGSTDIVLAGVNILRNFSMLADNHSVMVKSPELFQLLARISDARLARLPCAPNVASTSPEVPKKPYSILELARVRRDCVVILTNVGHHMDLRATSPSSVTAIFRLLSTFLSSGWESLHAKETIYGPLPSIRAVPSPVILSISHALEAWVKLSQTDSNREVLARCVPADELIEMFEGLVKLLPVSRRSFEAIHAIENSLAFTECLALGLYSLAFLSPPSIRTAMRSVPGAVPILTRLVFSFTASAQPNPSHPHPQPLPDFKHNPFGVLVRRVCETLGVLNGTVSASGDVEGMSFSAGREGAGGREGTGWACKNRVVERGWLAGEAERGVSALMVKGLDGPAFGELDGMLWAG